MLKIKTLIDRQLVIQSWPYGGLSPMNWVIVALIFLSAALFTVETEPLFFNEYRGVIRAANITVLSAFAFEFILRLWSAGETQGIRGLAARTKYAGRLWLFVDFLAFAPELIVMALMSAGIELPVAVDGLRAIRLLRLLKLIRFLPGGRIVVEVLGEVAPQLLVSLLSALGVVYGAAVVIYYAERVHDPEHFGSVVRALWWSVVTLTTVGYGDVYPHTVIGKVLAGVIAILGVGIIALPSGIIAGAFMDRLQVERQRQSGRSADEKADA